MIANVITARYVSLLPCSVVRSLSCRTEWGLATWNGPEMQSVTWRAARCCALQIATFFAVALTHPAASELFLVPVIPWSLALPSQ